MSDTHRVLFSAIQNDELVDLAPVTYPSEAMAESVATGLLGMDTPKGTIVVAQVWDIKNDTMLNEFEF